ncbi:MAG: WecB/TagA/CpsF family glycosyltransferase [Patescibacteria group bacterium]|jgi:N-acetylglucosaminyldiphosphoundecaprenol N-acetyl-beta-D-mannosaminyltransferase|nr:WecB/TagA/CpsF family glycosyltransferase [Patescibacteria group bacterium]
MTKFWGIDFQNHSKKETLKIVDDYLMRSVSGKPLIITTLNPELLLFAEKDEFYRNILNKAELKNVDGFGIKLMGWFKKKNVSERIAGVDLAGHILKSSIKNKLKIACVFRKDGLSSLSDIQNFLNNFQADIKCVEYDTDEEGRISEINLKMQDREVILVGLGVPYQEQIITENKKSWSSLKLAIGVGGTFDFWTGKQKRAPKIMRKIGVEWSWRLIIRPKRFWKIWRSTIVFMGKSLIK